MSGLLIEGSSPRIRLLIAVALSIVGASVGLGQSPPDVDLATGNIDGKQALGFWPTVFPTLEPIDPKGFEVRLAPVDDLDVEHRYACGQWFAPPPGKYRYWLEGPSGISPSALIMRYGARPFRGKGLAARSWVVPAGLVRLAEGVETGSGVSVRLIHTESHNRGEYPGQEMSRRVRVEGIGRGVRMPEGEVLAALYDGGKDEYIAISRPTLVLAGTVTEIAPRSPDSGSDLLVTLEREQIISDFARYDVALAVGGPDDEKRAADVVVPTAQRIYAVWYGLKGRLVHLEIESPTVFLLKQELVLRPGKVEVFRGQLARLPEVEVLLDLPEALRVADLSLTVLELPPRDLLRSLDLKSEIRTLRLDALPAKSLELVLQAGSWSFRQSVDLRDGLDTTVSFDPKPIVLTGTVTRGGEIHPATIELSIDMKQQQRRMVEDVGVDGRYEAVLWRSGLYLAWVSLAEVSGPPLLEVINLPDQPTYRHDFELPAALHRVRIVDSETGEAIAGAELTVGNAPLAGQSTSQIADSDEQGRVELAILRPGTASLRATAEGYESSEERIESVSDEHPFSITIALQPSGPASRLCLTLQDSRPAVGAEVRAQQSLHNAGAVWRGAVGDDGCVDLPEKTEGLFLMARHPTAALGIRRAPGADLSTSETVWTLPSSSPPLSIQTIDSSGDPAPRASLGLWIGEHSVRGPALAWLTFSPVAATDRNGFWQAKNLPASDLRVLAWMSSQNATAAAGGLDTLGVAVPRSRQSPIRIEVIQ